MASVEWRASLTDLHCPEIVEIERTKRKINNKFPYEQLLNSIGHLWRHTKNVMHDVKYLLVLFRFSEVERDHRKTVYKNTQTFRT